MLPRPGTLFAEQQLQRPTRPLMFPAPVRGINAVDPITSLSPEFALLMTNLIPDGRACRVRSGYQRFATNVGTNPIRTLIPFQGSTSANNRLFAVSQNGIYNISAGGSGPFTPTSFGITSGSAGYGSFTSFVADSGTYYAFYADEENGLYRYAEGGSWAAVTDISGPTASQLVFCVQHKGRMWFVQRNSGRAWYLPAGAISGTATAFNFGNKFAHGGTLVGLWNWTLDGGEGIDDHLVAISSGGDVMVYKGTDPASATTWELVGQYYVGALPSGRRIAAQFGGDLFVLNQFGVIPLSRLVQGHAIQEQDIYATRNITPLLTDDLDLYRNEAGWDIVSIPQEQLLAISVPKQIGFPFKQYAMSSKTGGWTLLNGLPFVCGAHYDGIFYLGGEGGIVYRMISTLDDIALDGTGGNPIQFRVLTAFTDAGEAGLLHRVQFIRPVFKAAASPTFLAQARYDYDLSELTGGGVALPAVAGTWDNGLWDVAIWGTDTATFQRVFGALGLGRAFAVFLGGDATAQTNLVRIDVYADTGGLF